MSTPPLPGRAVAGVPGTLRTRTVRVHGAMEDVPLLDLVPDVEAPLVSAWVRRGEGIVGWGRAATTAVTTAKADGTSPSAPVSPSTCRSWATC